MKPKKQDSRVHGMDVGRNGSEGDLEFWPIEHPIEPLDEDRPVKCPLPDSSLINDGRTHDVWFSESMRKRAELSANVNRGMLEIAVEPPVRAVRKRHHNLTRADNTITTPLMRMPPLQTIPPQTNMTIFHMLQQLDKFEP